MDNKIAQITSLISNDFNNFKIELKKIIENSNVFLKDDICNFVFSEAKFLRPRLIFIFSKILDIKNDNVTKIALITEILHNASLIHDDIIDESITRRNKTTCHIKYNTKIAVLTGDLLLAEALKLLSETNIKITSVFSGRILKTIQGELKQNENIKKITSQEEYFEKTFNKTGNLFFAGLESLFTLKEIDLDLKLALTNYLENFCFAFQIQNDIKDINTDYKNGNYTLPLIYYFKENSKYDKKKLEKYILKTKSLVTKYKNNAIQALGCLKEEYSKLLQELIEII